MYQNLLYTKQKTLNVANGQHKLKALKKIRIDKKKTSDNEN